jgi:uncharacterized protein
MTTCGMLGTVPAMPDLSPIHEGLFSQGDSPALIGGRCTKCGSVCFPRQRICPYCSEESVDEVNLSQTGTLWAWTAVTAPPPGYEGPVPYGFGVVELPEGVRIVTRLTESDPANLQYGQQMNLELVALAYDGAQVLTYAFAPAANRSAS